MADQTAVLKRDPEVLQKLHETLHRTVEACKPLLTPEIAERLHAVVWQQIRTSAALQACSPESIYTAVHRMAALGLDPSTPNDCWLVPFGKEAVLIPGYGGLRKMALQDPLVLDMDAASVCEHDHYEGSGPYTAPVHRFPPMFGPRGRTIGYYGLVLYRTQRVRLLEMSVQEIKAHRDRYSRAAKSEFWEETSYTADGVVHRKGSFDQMALKTVLRQLCNPKYVSLRPVAWEVLRQESVVADGPRGVVEHVSDARRREMDEKTAAEHRDDLFPASPYQAHGAATNEINLAVVDLTGVPDEGWRHELAALWPRLPTAYHAQAHGPLHDRATAPGMGKHLLNVAYDLISNTSVPAP